MNKLTSNSLLSVRTILSSSHINFLFGAGVNATLLPQMNKMEKTKKMAEKYLKKEVINLETDINVLAESKKNKIMKSFISELKDKIKEINFQHDDFKDIKNMFFSINNLINQTENRNSTMKQVNIYTVNYDSVIDQALDDLGFLYNVISSSNYSNHDKFFEMVGYDYKKRKYVPTYLISKIHGDIDDPILPNNNKYDESLQAKRFEILFNMRAQLSRPNSVLFIIGYSGKDTHINKLIEAATSFGLTVYWFLYDNKEMIPEELMHNVIVVEQASNDKKQNTTRTCMEVVDNIWQDQLEE